MHGLLGPGGGPPGCFPASPRNTRQGSSFVVPPRALINGGAVVGEAHRGRVEAGDRCKRLGWGTGVSHACAVSLYDIETHSRSLTSNKAHLIAHYRETTSCRELHIHTHLHVRNQNPHTLTEVSALILHSRARVGGAGHACAGRCEQQHRPEPGRASACQECRHPDQITGPDAQPRFDTAIGPR